MANGTTSRWGFNQTRAAKALGVSREHLNKVLNGIYLSEDLKTRLAAWLKGERKKLLKPSTSIRQTRPASL